MKKAVLHVALKFAHHEVTVLLIIPLTFKATCPSFHTVTVPEVGGHMNWAGCQYGHNLEPHRLHLVHVIRDVVSDTLN